MEASGFRRRGRETSHLEISIHSHHDGIQGWRRLCQSFFHAVWGSSLQNFELNKPLFFIRQLASGVRELFITFLSVRWLYHLCFINEKMKAQRV
jgi:hypothetical protein